MDINESKKVASMVADFYKKVKGVRKAYPENMSYELTNNYLIIADHESINDKSEEYEAPAEYYVLPIVDSTNYLHIRCYDEYEDGPVFIIDGENTIIFEAEDRNGNFSRDIAREIQNAIIDMAEDFTIARCEDAQMEMVHPGYKAVLWLANGDPGYPAEPAEYRGECPHCKSDISETGGSHRCESCNKFYRVTYDRDW